jgi:hypothetical protein
VSESTDPVPGPMHWHMPVKVDTALPEPSPQRCRGLHRTTMQPNAKARIYSSSHTVPLYPEDTSIATCPRERGVERRTEPLASPAPSIGATHVAPRQVAAPRVWPGAFSRAEGCAVVDVKLRALDRRGRGNVTLR